MKQSDVKLYLTIAAVGVGAYFLWKLLSTAKDVGSAAIAIPGNIGSKIGLSLYDFFNPPTGRGLVSILYFLPDGSRHAIDSADVDGSGSFTYSGVNYVMRTGSDGKHYAVAA